MEKETDGSGQVQKLAPEADATSTTPSAGLTKDPSEHSPRNSYVVSLVLICEHCLQPAKLTATSVSSRTMIS